MAIPVLLERATAELSFDSHPFGALPHAPFLAFDNPSLDPIQNRSRPGPDRISSRIHVWFFPLPPAALQGAA
jgi:hypothetical protein